MTAPIWMAAPPEVHSALLSSGPGAGSLFAAASAWSSLSTEYAAIADELTALLGAAQAGAWQGPSAEAYIAANAPYLAWLMQASADSAATAAQQEIAASAYTIALATMPTLAELAANHASHAVLVATNFFGINTIPIALNETDYVRMWVQAATVMSTYQAVAGAAVAAAVAAQTAPAPQIVKSNATAATSGNPFPDQSAQVQQFLDQIGYTNFYNNVLQPLVNLLANNPYLEGLFQGVDPYLTLLGNPLEYLTPSNVVFALGYPLPLAQFIAYLSETFSFIGADITAAFATGNPSTIGLTLIFDTIEAIGTIITDVIALLHRLLEQTLTLIPAILPLLNVPLVPLGAPLAAAPGLAGLAGLAELPPLNVASVAPPFGAALAPAPAPAPAAAPAAPAPGAPPPPAGAPPPPAGTPPPPAGTGMEGFAYMVGGLNLSERQASTSAKKKALEPDTAEAAAVAAAAQEQAPARRRRRAKATVLGRGYEYMDLDPDASPEDPRAPSVPASGRGAGPLGFAGAVHKADAGEPAGLTTMTDDSFGGSSTTPMMPSTWSRDLDGG